MIILCLCAKSFLAKLTRKQKVVDTLGTLAVAIKIILPVKSFATRVRTLVCLLLFNYKGLFKITFFMVTTLTHPVKMGSTYVTSNIGKRKIVPAGLTLLSNNLGTGEHIARWSHS